MDPRYLTGSAPSGNTAARSHALTSSSRAPHTQRAARQSLVQDNLTSLGIRPLGPGCPDTLAGAIAMFMSRRGVRCLSTHGHADNQPPLSLRCAAEARRAAVLTPSPVAGGLPDPGHRHRNQRRRPGTDALSSLFSIGEARRNGPEVNIISPPVPRPEGTPESDKYSSGVWHLLSSLLSSLVSLLSSL